MHHCYKYHSIRRLEFVSRSKKCYTLIHINDISEFVVFESTITVDVYRTFASATHVNAKFHFLHYEEKQQQKQQSNKQINWTHASKKRMYVECIRAMHVIHCAFRCIFPQIPTVDAGIDTHISFRCCCLYRYYFIVFVCLSLCDLNAMCMDLCRKWSKMKCVSC